MSFAARGDDPVSHEALTKLLHNSSFRAVADLLVDAVFIVDLEGNVAFLNRAAEKISGLKRADVQSQSFEKFLRQSDLEMDEWLAAAAKGRGDGLVRVSATGAYIPATKRVIAVAGHRRGFELITLHVTPDKANAKRSKAKDASGGTDLLFPPDLAEHVEKAVRAYQRGARVLLLGESGVGKTAVARHIHEQAASASAPFVHVNCGSITESLFESEMFGYERGAFTGALQAGKKGFVEAARGGTLFLDEIGEIPLPGQAKLLKFLEDGTIQPVGSAMSKRIETTVITATNRNLREMVQNGGFRQDLFYRIATFPCTIPPLRQRPDKGALIDSFVDRVNVKRKPKLKLSKDCRKLLLDKEFVGNMRELRSVIEYLDIVADEIAKPEDLHADIFAGVSPQSSVTRPVGELGAGETLKSVVAAFERDVIEEAIKNAPSKRKAAEKLGIDVATLIRKQARETGSE